MRWMAGSEDPSIHRELEAESSQVAEEIRYFAGLYKGLKPVLYLSYDREAYRLRDGLAEFGGSDGFRVTFDTNILCRETDLTLESEAYGKPILEEGMFLMELKCPGAIPLWMVKILSEEHIYKTSFSKYGTAYCRFMKEAYTNGRTVDEHIRKPGGSVYKPYGLRGFVRGIYGAGAADRSRVHA